MSTVVVRAPLAGTSPGPQRRDAPRRAELEVVSPRTRRVRHRRIAPLLSAAVVSASLFAVVVGHAALAQDQVRLAKVQAALTAAQAVHRSDVLSVANLENPARILYVAEKSLHMVPPSQVDQLPHVTLDAPLSAPAVAPATSGSSTGSTASTASTGSGAAAGSGA